MCSSGLLSDEKIAADFCMPNPYDAADIFPIGHLALGIAMVTFSYRSVKVALTNPVSSMKYERYCSFSGEES